MKWLRVGTSGGLFRTRERSLGFDNIWKSSCHSKEQPASPEGPWLHSYLAVEYFKKHFHNDIGQVGTIPATTLLHCSNVMNSVLRPKAGCADCFMDLLSYSADRGSTVVKVLCYKSEGRWFDCSWCQWIFH